MTSMFVHVFVMLTLFMSLSHVSTAQRNYYRVDETGQRLTPTTIVKEWGDWTWFTVDGVLYRKHIKSSTAEVWYGVRPDYNGSAGGKMFDTALVTEYEFYEGLPRAIGFIGDVRLSDDGTIWYGGTQGFASYKDKRIKAAYIYGNATAWPVNSPYEGETFTALRGEDQPLPENLLLAMPNAGFRLRRWSQKESPRTTPVVCSTLYGYNYHDIQYRLVYAFEIAFDGTVHISTDDGVYIFRPKDHLQGWNPTPSVQVRVTPNPSSSLVTFTIEDEGLDRTSVDIRDSEGRMLIGEIDGNVSSTTVNVESLESGTYIAVIRFRNRSITVKFSVLH